MTEAHQDQVGPAANALGGQLRSWRRMNNMKQAGLASLLGVSQPTIARWEQGLDVPSQERMSQIIDLMAGTLRDEYALERLLIERQSSIRALMDMDGMKLNTVSAGYRQLWPEFSAMTEVPLADDLINEMRVLLDDRDLMHRINRGSVGLISGVSDRHFEFKMDQAFRHRWHICFRRYGTGFYADIAFELCNSDADPGIHDRVEFDTFGSVRSDSA
ncbi:helix-turn-helix domain-containing protein [Methylopila musalis]|uniref:Helix-turn-helix domain-containing protein n=1 Tax=Methylopila musalis TaxID=1134781 RepID=A0ABW3Z2G7_9HYPH